MRIGLLDPIGFQAMHVVALKKGALALRLDILW